VVKKTKAEALETRNLILDTAESVFAEKGVSRTTLNDIAKAAGVTRGAIYWHFKNKADLFTAMLKRVTLPMDEFLSNDKPSASTSMLDHILKRTLNVVQILTQNPRTQRVFDIVMHKAELVDEMAAIRDQHLAGRENCLEKITADLQQAIQNGEIPSHINPNHAAIGIHALLDGLFCNWVLAPNNFNLPEQVNLALSNHLQGLKRNSEA
jgi:TetR/AcrR family acrAB operon transcriptional repressor